jgi:hypothetical protein
MTSSILAAWRAIVSLSMQDVTSGQRMKFSNDALYMSHCLNSDDPNIIAEKNHLWYCGNAWFNQELVYPCIYC